MLCAVSWKRHARQSLSNADGFTLIELLVAFAVLAISLGVLFEVYSTSIRNSGRSDTQRMAVLLARSTLDRIGSEIPLVPGELSGELGNGFTWHVAISDYADASDQQWQPERAFQIVITVLWHDSGADRSVSLATMRLTPKG